MLKNIHILDKSSGNKIELHKANEINVSYDENHFESAWMNAVLKGLVDGNNRKNYVITIVEENLA